MRESSVLLMIALLMLAGLLACGDGDSSVENSQAAGQAQKESAGEGRASSEAAKDGPGEDGAVVLMYHRFGEDDYPSTSVRMEQFRAHLDYLDREGFAVWPLERVAEYLLEGKSFPDKTVAISIDDAYESIYEQAYPLFREYDWPFTVFVNSDSAGGGNYMSWAQMREMAENSQARFANHTASHDYLVARQEGESEADWEARVRADIQRAEQALQEQLPGHVTDSPALFAYPYGEYDLALREIVEDMGYVAFGQHSGPVGHYSDIRALPRFAMAENYASAEDFRLRVNTRPLPIRKISPADPTAIDQNNPPELRLEFADTGIALERINCFASGRAARMEWVSDDPRTLVVQAEAKLGQGRSRYNCTAPARQGGFHWFSFQWIHGRR